jgi:hypothetical protein
MDGHSLNLRLKLFTVQTPSTVKHLKCNLETDVLWTGSIRYLRQKSKAKPTQLGPRGKDIVSLYAQISSK